MQKTAAPMPQRGAAARSWNVSAVERCVRLQKCLRALRIERSTKLLELVELHYAMTDIRSHDEPRQRISETAFVQNIEQ